VRDARGVRGPFTLAPFPGQAAGVAQRLELVGARDRVLLLRLRISDPACIGGHYRSTLERLDSFATR